MTFSTPSRSALLLLAVTVAQAVSAKSLDVYFVDVEGGQSTLLVTPQRQSLLMLQADQLPAQRLLRRPHPLQIHPAETESAW